MEKITLVPKERLDEISGTHHKFVEINAHEKELEAILGKENVGKSCDGKIFHAWFVQVGDKQFTIYDNNYSGTFHIGSKYDKKTDKEFANELNRLIKEYRKKEIKERLHELGYALSCKRESLTRKTKRIHDLKQLIHSHRCLAYAEPFNDMECRLHLCQMHIYEDELKQERSCLARYQYEQKQRKDEFKKLNTELNKIRN